MKQFALVALSTGTMLAATSPADAQVNRRQWDQQQRIQQGARSGGLNRREYYRFQHRQARTARYESAEPPGWRRSFLA